MDGVCSFLRENLVTFLHQYRYPPAVWQQRWIRTDRWSKFDKLKSPAMFEICLISCQRDDHVRVPPAL